LGFAVLRRHRQNAFAAARLAPIPALSRSANFVFRQRTKRVNMSKDTFRIVTRGANGKIHIHDYARQESLQRIHTQIGVDDCSTDLALRGLPVFRGLIGPMPEGNNVIRYESPEVFETLTKEWTTSKVGRRTKTKQEALSDS
jgi:hypothetical protein